MQRHACSFVRRRFGFPLRRIDFYEWIPGLLPLMKWKARDGCWFICYIAMFHPLLAADRCWAKLWWIAAGGIEFLPWRQVDLSLLESLGAQGDHLYQGILVVQDLPLETESNTFFKNVIQIPKIIWFNHHWANIMCCTIFSTDIKNPWKNKTKRKTTTVHLLFQSTLPMDCFWLCFFMCFYQDWGSSVFYVFCGISLFFLRVTNKVRLG